MATDLMLSPSQKINIIQGRKNMKNGQSIPKLIPPAPDEYSSIAEATSETSSIAGRKNLKVTVATGLDSFRLAPDLVDGVTNIQMFPPSINIEPGYRPPPPPARPRRG